MKKSRHIHIESRKVFMENVGCFFTNIKAKKAKGHTFISHILLEGIPVINPSVLDNSSGFVLFVLHGMGFLLNASIFH